MSASGSKRSSDRTDLSEISHTVGHEFCTMPLSFARVAKLVDAPGLGPDAVKGVPVRVRPLAPNPDRSYRRWLHVISSCATNNGVAFQAERRSCACENASHDVGTKPHASICLVFAEKTNTALRTSFPHTVSPYRRVFTWRSPLFEIFLYVALHFRKFELEHPVISARSHFQVTSPKCRVSLYDRLQRGPEQKNLHDGATRSLICHGKVSIVESEQRPVANRHGLGQITVQ